jgi:hypothetical protein
MDKLSVDKVLFDLERLLAMAAGAHALATDGVRLELKHLMDLPRHPDNPDPLLYFGVGDPNDPAANPYAAWKTSNLPAMLAEDGFVVRQLGQQWAVFVFAEWESWVRPRLAQAHGCQIKDIAVDVFGDLRRIRHDIVHNGGTASATWSARCRLLRWFEAGHPLIITAKHVAEFMRQVPWMELGSAPIRAAQPPQTRRN